MLNKESKPIPDFLRRKIRRGFDKTVLPQVANDLYQKVTKEKNKLSPPTSIVDLFRVLESKDPESYCIPYHLRPFISRLERAAHEDIKCVVHSAGQTGKTTTTVVGLIYLALTVNNFSSMYVTYSQTRSTHVLLNNFLPILNLLGINYYKRENVITIDNVHGKKNYIYFVSVDGPITGYTAQLLCIDDYIKSVDDLTFNAKNKVQEWYLTAVMNRKSTQFSVIVIATRHANDDLSGRLIKDHGFEYCRLAAICDDE
jgi:hypothetical protein